MALGISFVAFQDEPKLVSYEIQQHFRSNWSQQPTPTEPMDKDNTISFRVGSSDVILGMMPVPIPWSDLEGPCATSLLWPNATQVLKEHKYHAIVTVNGDLDPISLSTLLTQATASVMASSPLAVGVYWANATLVVPKDMFIDFAIRVLPLGPPIYIWVDFRVGKNGNNSCAGFTTGLEALGHMEFETTHAPETVAELRERLFTLTSYVLENGPVIKDGNTVGNDASERIKVRYASSAFGNPNQVILLEYEQSPKKRPWWKPW